MKMQDYRRAADRVHIAEHCRQEVLSMNKHTEPKSRTPITRMAAGIAAAAAVLTVTGGFGYLLLSMKDDVQRGPANTDSEIADQSAAYISYFRDYYELRAGHPVDFDFSTLCGTDFDMAWEMDGCTVTLNAAICDGYEIDYIYTIEKDSPVTLDEDGFAEIPVLNLRPNDPIAPEQFPAGSTTDMIDTTENEDGTYSIRFIGRYQHIFPDTPLSPEEDLYAQCLPRIRDEYEREAASMRAEEDENARPVTVSLPEEIPEYQPLSAPLRVERTGVIMPASDDFTGAIVTPLSVRISNHSPEDFVDVLRQMNLALKSGSGYAVGEQTVTVQKSISGQEPQDVALALWVDDVDDSKIGPWCYGSHITVDPEGYTPAIEYATYYLSFTEPLDLSEVDYLTFGSEQTDAVTLPVNGEAPTEDTPDADLITAETEEFPPFNILNAQWRTKEYGFGFVTAEGISYDENGNPVMNLTIIPNKSFTIEEGDTLELRMMPLGYDNNGYCYEIRNDEVMQGFKWTTGAQADENGEYHVQLTLDPLSKAYYRVQNEDGEYVSESGDANEAIYWETLDIALFLNELRVVHPDGTDRTFTGDGTEDDVFLKFRFGTAAYPAFAEIPEAARTRHIDFADVRLADATRDGNIVEMKFGVRLDDSVTVQEGDTVALVPFVASRDSNFEVIECNSMESEYTATAPDADGWYYFYDKVDISDLPETEQVLFNCSVHCLRIHRGNEGIVYDVTPHTAKEVEATLFCRFSLD